ncbi:MAG: tRNA (guanosine(46)-N7)-methyltransferase TrmB [Bacilli bacterium]
MRLKKVKGAKEIVSSSNYIITNPSDFKSKFQSLFNNNYPIHVEIGIGKGDFIINMALAYPNVNFIGIEKYESVLYRAIQKLSNKKIDNLKLICIDAKEINNIFYYEIETLYLNFSDPWPKKRHEKRRLTSDTFLKKYDLIFKNGNNIIMKTDNQHLFEYSIASFVNNDYKIKFISLDLHKTNVFNIETEYEVKFNTKGFRIYKIEVYK